MINYNKPFLKWVGGKTQILNNLFELFPIEIDNYYEPFLGGGSVLIHLLSLINDKKIKINGKITVSDINKELIDTYNEIKNNPINLINELEKIKTEYLSMNNIENKKKYFYELRELYNFKKLTNVETSALFIFLNKTCFRGIFRMGPNGFNVPFGNYKNPDIYEKNHILYLSNLFKLVQFENYDIEVFLNKIDNFNKKDFIYFDPPYINTYDGYTKDGFKNKNKILFKKINDNYDNLNFILSNSENKIIDEYFDKKKYNIKIIACKRRINSKNPASKSNEILIKKINY